MIAVGTRKSVLKRHGRASTLGAKDRQSTRPCPHMAVVEQAGSVGTFGNTLPE